MYSDVRSVTYFNKLNLFTSRMRYILCQDCAKQVLFVIYIACSFLTGFCNYSHQVGFDPNQGMCEGRRVQSVWQPTSSGRGCLGYPQLCRGTHPG